MCAFNFNPFVKRTLVEVVKVTYVWLPVCVFKSNSFNLFGHKRDYGSLTVLSACLLDLHLEQLEAQQNMHCALRRTNGDTQKNSDRGRDSLSRKFQEQNGFQTSSEDCEVPSIAWRNSDPSNWRIVALPLQCPENTNSLGSGAQVNMDILHRVYPLPINPFKVNQQKVQKELPLAGTYSGKSFTNRSFTGSTVRHQSQNKTLVYKATECNELSRKSCQESLTCSDSSSMIQNHSSANNSLVTVIGNMKIDSVVKRNSRKKSRKKGKQSKKFSCDAGSVEQDVLSEEYTNGSSASETCGNNYGDGRVSSSTAPEVSLPNSGVKHFETPKTCISDHDELDIPSVGNLENPVLLKDSGFHIFDGEGGIQHTQVSSCKDSYTKGYSDMLDSFVLDSISVGSDSDESTNSDHDGKHAEKEIFRIEKSEPPDFSSRNGYFSSQSSLNVAVDTYDHTKGTRRGIQVCSSSGMQLVVPGKRSKQNRAAQRNANVSKLGSTGNLQIRTEKENSHSVWKKVQRNAANDRKGELKKESSVYPQFDLTMIEAPLLKNTCSSVDVNRLSKSEDKKQQKDKFSKKLKRKSGPALKQEYNCCSRKGSHANVTDSDGCVKVSMQVKDKKGLSVSRNCSQPSFPRAESQIGKVERMTSESVRSMQLCTNEMDNLGSLCDTVSGMKNSSVKNQDSSIHKICDSLNESNLHQGQSPIYLPHLICNAARKAQKENSLAESSRQNPSAGSLTHKWMPIGLKDPGLASSSRSDSSSCEHSDEPAAKKWTFNDSVKGNVVSNTQNLISKASVVCTGPSSGDVTCSAEKVGDMLPKLGCQDASKIKEINNKLDAASCMNFETKDLNAFEADSNRLLQAVNNACRAQLASEAVQMATGGPIAEFERLLYYSSPVIHQSPNFIGCHTCSRNQVGSTSLCRHETPNITLGCLWQWYEKNGSYGLEIRAEDFGNSKRSGADHFAFRAYFVPYLSGIQLFRNCRSDSVDTSNRVCSSEVLSTCGNSETSKKSYGVGHLPIFSVLFPQPRKEDAITEPLVNQFCSSEQSSASAKDSYFRLADTTGSSESELVFEYFESEQPQHRRPLYDKIQELVRGDGPPDSKVYGDPTKLDSINLNDLHPRSWYSVAWYPIYRIPDGKFHAAFLTYHSLGHWVCKSAKSESPSVDTCIVSPVVGLQSYNAQDECWFQPRYSAPRQTKITPGLNPCRVLDERLRTLEETASLMARAVVNKGSTTSVNRHPDYEFFFSRRRM